MCNDFFRGIFGEGFNVETKEEVTNKYIQGLIDKDEFIRRMNNAIDNRS